MKLKFEFTKNEAVLLTEVSKKYDFTNSVDMEMLSKEYTRDDIARKIKYSGISENGATLEFEVHEKLINAAARVYIKYSDTVNGILCTMKSLIVSCKGLFKNFESDYKKELNSAFEEIRKEAKEEKENKDIVD